MYNFKILAPLPTLLHVFHEFSISAQNDIHHLETSLLSSLICSVKKDQLPVALGGGVEISKQPRLENISKTNYLVESISFHFTLHQFGQTPFTRLQFFFF